MERISKITCADHAAYALARERWNSIAKPLGSFGELELMIQKIAGIQGSPQVDISKRWVVVMCADHGVTAQGVTQCGSEVTAKCAADIAAGHSNVNAVAAANGAKVLAVDMGMVTKPDIPGLVDCRIASGTADMTAGSAMSREQAVQAVSAGIDIVCGLKKQGAQLIVTGEMGIGNTTAASAIAAAVLGEPVQRVTGRGAGLSDEGLSRKIRAIEKALAVNAPDPDDPLDVLSKVGGFEIAGMTGLFLGGAYCRVPVVIDGVISAAAAAIACKLNPLCAEDILPSHCSGEPAGEGLLRLMGLRPVIDAGLRLGEGTGGLLLIPLLESALALYRNARHFSDTTIERYTDYK